MKITAEHIAEFDMMDDYNNLIVAGQEYLSGFYLEREERGEKGGIVYSLYTKKKFFFKESIEYPFVQFETSHKGKRGTHFINNQVYCDTLNFIEETNMTRLC